MNKKLVSIDFWDTLVIAGSGSEKRNKIRADAIMEVAEKHKLQLAEKKLKEVYEKLSLQFHDIWFNEHRTLPPETILRTYTGELGIAIKEPELEYLLVEYERSFIESPPELAKNASAVIPELSAKYHLAIISDTMVTPGKTLCKFLDSKGLLTYFSSFLFSDEAGYSKPDKRAFQKVLAECACEPGSSSHIGDRLNTDIAGAKSVGMKAALFTGIADRSSELNGKYPKPDFIFPSWMNAGEVLLA